MYSSEEISIAMSSMKIFRDGGWNQKKCQLCQGSQCDNDQLIVHYSAYYAAAYQIHQLTDFKY